MRLARSDRRNRFARVFVGTHRNLRRPSIVVVLLVLGLLSNGFCRKQASAGSGQTASTLEGVLNQMDVAAAQFRSAEADFVWEQYQKVINETETQKGKMYFRRTSKGDTQMSAHFEQPDEKFVIFTDGKLRVYQPKIDQVNEYDAGKNRAEFESFLVLGFGGRGHDLQQQFDVTFDGNETIDGLKTAKLELSPKSARVKGMIDKFVIWVDAPRGVSLKQQAFEPSGDYRTAHYTGIKLNTKVPDDVFKLHVSGKTKTVKGS